MSIQGIVYRVHSGNYFVRTAEGVDFVCKLRGNLKKSLEYSTSKSHGTRVIGSKKRHVTDAVAVGDTVNLNPDLLIIEEILPRRTDLSRHSPSRRGQHTLVANLDQVFVVFAAADPRPNFWLIDRFLVMAESAEVKAHIVVNKADLEGNIDDSVRAEFKVYERIGYRVLWISAAVGTGLDAVRELLPGHISAVTGPSGVGKSRLLNAIIPGAMREVGRTSVQTGQGRHTTTASELVPVAGTSNAWIADTPGLRQLDYWDVDIRDMAHFFIEFLPYLGECKFQDCSHQTEAGCAITAALRAGLIHPRRYESYLQMLHPEDAPSN